MAPKTKTKAAAKPAPKWIIDLHGVLDALSSGAATKSKVVDAIKSGEMLVMRSVQADLKNAFPDAWEEFADIKGKKYVDTTVAITSVAAQMQEAHGSSILGGVPSFAHFEAVALARSQKCKLVSAKKGLSDCQSIAKSNGLPKSDIIKIKDI